MRIPDFNCGCESRREIIFTRGQLGAPEAGIIVLAAIALLVTLHKGKASPK